MKYLITVHSLNHCEMVLRVAKELKIKVSLQTKPFAGVSLGSELFYNIIGVALKQFPNTLEEAWLDCGNQESAVLQAFESGCKHVYFSGDNDETLEKLKSLASKYKARVRQRINEGYDRYNILELADISKLENQEQICKDFLTTPMAGKISQYVLGKDTYVSTSTRAYPLQAPID